MRTPPGDCFWCSEMAICDVKTESNGRCSETRFVLVWCMLFFINPHRLCFSPRRAGVHPWLFFFLLFWIITITKLSSVEYDMHNNYHKLGINVRTEFIPSICLLILSICHLKCTCTTFMCNVGLKIVNILRISFLISGFLNYAEYFK